MTYFKTIPQSVKKYASEPTGLPFIYIALVCCLSTGPLPGFTGTTDKSEWPCFHGSDRNSKSAETGLLKKWPEAGPDLLWTVSGLGEGYSSVTIAGGYLYTAGMMDKQTFVFAFDLDGKQIWKKPNGKSWETTRRHAISYTGSRSTPTYDDGVVYHLGELGRLSALEYKTGKEIWSQELRELYEADIPKYGYTESVLIDGDRLYCNPAGKKGFMVCLDKKSGKLIWANTGVPGTVAYSSPVIAEFDGSRQIIAMSSSCVFGTDIMSGKLLWSVDFGNQRSNSATDPIYHHGHVFASSGYGKGSILIKLTVSGKKIVPETVWQKSIMDNHHGGVVLHDGYLYGAGHNSRGWFCLDFSTGKQMWNDQGKGSLFFADGLLYCMEERGTMKLVKSTPDRYELVSSFKVPHGGKGLYWAHPVVCGGRLYVRHADKLYVYDVKDK